MEILRTLNLTQAGDAKEAVLDNWARDMDADGIVFDLEMPVTVGAVGGTPAVADLVAALKYFLGTVNLYYGANQQYRPLEGADGVDLRRWHRGANLNEVPNDFVGVAAKGAPGAQVWKARVVYALRHPTMRGRQKRVGWVQGRSVYVKVQEANAIAGAVITGGITRTGGATAKVALKPLYRVNAGKRSPWSPFPTFRRIVKAELDLLGPDGLTLLCYDENAAYAATALTKYSLRIGDRELIRQVTPETVYDEWGRTIDAGGSDLSDDVTLVYAADPYGDIEEAPHGQVYLKLVTQDVASLKLGFWHYPDIGESESKDAAVTTATRLNQPVLGSVPEVKDTADYGAPSTQPIEFVGPGDARFAKGAGVIATPDGETMLSIPPYEVETAGAIIGATPAPSRPLMAKLLQKRTAMRVPGAIRTSGKGRGGALGRQGIRGVFGRFF